MTNTRQPDDLDRYIETLTDEEREGLVDAGIALDISMLLYRAREQKGLSQAEAAKLAGLQQQAVSRLEDSEGNPRIETVSTYLEALGYSLELRAIDSETGKELFSLPFPGQGRKPASRKRTKKQVPAPQGATA